MKITQEDFKDFSQEDLLHRSLEAIAFLRNLGETRSVIANEGGTYAALITRLESGSTVPRRETLLNFLVNISPFASEKGLRFDPATKRFAMSHESRTGYNDWDVFYRSSRTDYNDPHPIRRIRLKQLSENSALVQYRENEQGSPAKFAVEEGFIHVELSKPARLWDLVFTYHGAYTPKKVFGGILVHQHPQEGVLSTACMVYRYDEDEIPDKYNYRPQTDKIPDKAKDMVSLLSERRPLKLTQIQKTYDQVDSQRRELVGYYEYYFRSTRPEAHRSSPSQSVDARIERKRDFWNFSSIGNRFVGEVARGFLQIDESFQCRLFYDRQSELYPEGRVVFFQNNPNTFSLHLNRRQKTKPIRLVVNLPQSLSLTGRPLLGTYATVDHNNLPEAGLIVLRKMEKAPEEVPDPQTGEVPVSAEAGIAGEDGGRGKGFLDTGVLDLKSSSEYYPRAYENLSLFYLNRIKRSVVRFPTYPKPSYSQPCTCAGIYYLLYTYRSDDTDDDGSQTEIRCDILQIFPNYSVYLKSTDSVYAGDIDININANRFFIRLAHSTYSFRQRHIYGQISARTTTPQLLTGQFVAINKVGRHHGGRMIMRNIDPLVDKYKSEAEEVDGAMFDSCAEYVCEQVRPLKFSLSDNEGAAYKLLKRDVPELNTILKAIANSANCDFSTNVVGLVENPRQLDWAIAEEPDLKELYFKSACFHAYEKKEEAEVIKYWNLTKDLMYDDEEREKKLSELVKIWPALKGKLK